MLKYGFTLIELLVTVAITGILAAMATSVFQEYKYKANFIAAEVTLGHLITAMQAWISTEWDGESGAVHRWIHYADGTDAYLGQGADFRDFYPEPSIASNIFIYARVDTRCLLLGNVGCWADSPIGATIGHCEAMSSPTLAKAKQYYQYNNSPPVRQVTTLSKSDYNCP